MLGLDFETLGSVMNVEVPLGRDYELTFGCSSVHIKISGMEWLLRYQILKDCAQ